MIHEQNIKFAGFELDATGASHNVDFDTNGADYLVIHVYSEGGTGQAFAAASLLESDDNSTYTAISGSDFSSGLTSPAAVASGAGNAYVFVDLRGKKRYIRATLDAGGAFSVITVGYLGRNEEAPITAAAAGVASRLVI